MPREILSRMGLGAKESLANSIAIGGTNLSPTFVPVYILLTGPAEQRFIDHRFVGIH